MRMLSLLILFSISLGSNAAVAAEDWWRVYGEIKPGTFYGGHQHGKEPLTDLQKELPKTTNFDEWVTYEDEFVRLQYPKHPALTFEKNEGTGGISVEGGVCTTVDNSFSRAYVLKVGSATYGVFLLNPADWLEDHDEKRATGIVHAYAKSDHNEYYPFVATRLADLDVEIAEEFIIKALAEAMKERDAELAEEILTAIPEMEFSEVAKIRTAVEELPKGREGQPWLEMRAKALKSLSGKQ